MRTYVTTDPALRFPRHYVIDDETGCWDWTSAIDNNGYGKFNVGNRRSIGAHRYSYELHRGPIPAGLHVDHLCRNRSCVNPWHLEAVTAGENVLRGVGGSAQNARKTHCLRGHEFTPENTIVKRTPRVIRVCRTCDDLRWLRRRVHSVGNVKGHKAVRITRGDWRCLCGVPLGHNQETARDAMRPHRVEVKAAQLAEAEAAA